MSKRSTLKEIAEELELSVATVSRALGGYEDIALRTRERVAAKAREMGYVPNSAGRMLVSGRSGFVSLVVPARGPEFLDAFLGQFVIGLGEGLRKHGADLSLAIAAEDQSELDVIEKLTASGRADAIVLTRVAEEDERVDYLRKRSFPFVTHGRIKATEEGYSWLDTCGETAFAEAFERLYGLGHRRFGLVTISDSMGARRRREQGLMDAIARMNDPILSLVEVRGPRADMGQIKRQIANTLQKPERPTAMIGLFDELALAALQVATQSGLDIPGDLSIIGFDNLMAAEMSNPGLSTFDQDVRGSAGEIAAMVHKLMDGTAIRPISVLKKPQFVARGSHGPAPGFTPQTFIMQSKGAA